MEHRTDAPDALLTRALEEQLSEQRALNDLLGRVEAALTGVQQRMDGVERRLDAQEQALRAVNGAQETAERVSGDVRAGLERQAEHLGALRAGLAGDAGRAVEQVAALTAAVEAMHGELAERIEAAGRRGGEVLAEEAGTRLDEQGRRLEALRDAVGADLASTAEQMVGLAGDARRAVEQVEVLRGAVEAMHGELADAISAARGELLEHVRSAAEAVDDAAARLGGISADHAASTAAVAETARVELRAAGEQAEALGQAVARLQGAEAEITDALARLGDGLERAAQEAARAGRIHSVRALEPALLRLERLGDAFVERLAGAEPELTCRACGFRAKNRAGLAAHRRSHG